MIGLPSFSRWVSRIPVAKRFVSARPPAYELSETEASYFRGEYLSDPPGTLVRVEPFIDSQGFEGADDLLRTFHPDEAARGGAQATFSIEWWSDGEITPYILAPDEGIVTDAVYSHYPSSQMEVIEDTLFPEAEEGEWVAGGYYWLSESCLHPILSAASQDGIETDPYRRLLSNLNCQDGERALFQVTFTPAGREWFERGWYGASGSSIAEEYKKGEVRGTFNPTVVQTAASKRAGKEIERQDGKIAYRVVVRAFVIAPKEDLAVERLLSITDAMGEYENPIRNSRVQEFELEAHTGTALMADVQAGYERRIPHTEGRLKRWWGGPEDILTIDELGGVAHLPNRDVNQADLSWSRVETTGGVPTGAPAFDFEGYGIREDAPRKVKQLVMIETAEPGDSYWYGWGMARGEPAGVYDEFLNAHQFFPGRTRMGKTTALTNFVAQAMRRFYGDRRNVLHLLAEALENAEDVLTVDPDLLDAVVTAGSEAAQAGPDDKQGAARRLLGRLLSLGSAIRLTSDDQDPVEDDTDADGAVETGETIEGQSDPRDNEGGIIVDPKGVDGDDFVGVYPPDRPEEDLIVIDLGDEREVLPQINMLEIPEGIDPDSRMFDSYANAVADTAEMMIAEVYAHDNLGSLMSRVTRTLSRGMSQSGRSTTFLDLAACASYKGNFEQFGQWMSDERLDFIAQAAQRMSEADNDINLNPLAGCFDEYVQPDSIRQLISAREPTLDIQAAVNEGKWIVLIFPKEAGTTEVTTLTNCYLAETYMAKRLSDNEAPFHFIGDEVHNFTTSQSMLPRILSQGGGLGYRVTLACQNPATQLKDAEKVRDAVQDNVDIWNTFRVPESGSNYISTQHSGIDKGDLEELNRYTSYLVQYTDDAKDVSTLIEDFPPLLEVREEVLGESARSDEEIQALKRRSMDRYGDPLPTAEEQQAESPFFGEGEGEESANLEITDRVIEATVAAIYGVSVRQDNTGGDVQTEDAVAAVRRSLAHLPETPDADELQDLLPDGDGDALYQRVLQYIPEDVLEHSGSTVRPKTPRKTLAPVGESPSDGGADHAQTMWDAWDGLAWAGLDMMILDTGGDDPDGIAWPAPEDEQHNPELVKRLVGQEPDTEARIESEKATTESKGGYTVQHVLQAAEEGRRTIVLCRPEATETTADKLLREPQYARSDHDRDGETRYYNVGDLKITHGGERTTMKRPGSSENVWVNDREDIVLRDDSGTEHARFEDPEDVFTDADAYPGGNRAVKRPVIPEAFDMSVDPHAEILPTPEGADGLDDVSLVTGPDGLTIPANAVGRDDDSPTVTPADLDGDVSTNAKDLLRFIHEDPAVEEPFTKRELYELPEEHDHVPENLDVSRNTINDWVNDLAEAGAVEQLERDDTGAMQWRSV